jgi:hypothetical protein
LIDRRIKIDRWWIREQTLKDLRGIERVDLRSEDPQVEETVCRRPRSFFKDDGSTETRLDPCRRREARLAREEKHGNQHKANDSHSRDRK